jgi:hypothetical protein
MAPGKVYGENSANGEIIKLGADAGGNYISKRTKAYRESKLLEASLDTQAARSDADRTGTEAPGSSSKKMSKKERQREIKKLEAASARQARRRDGRDEDHVHNSDSSAEAGCVPAVKKLIKGGKK